MGMKMANQNVMQLSLGSKHNPMNLILSGHDKGIQVSFKSKDKKKNKIVCPGHKQVWIPPPAKSTRRMKHCCLYPNNEIMLTLPEDGQFLMPYGFPLIIESNHLENFKAAIYPPQVPYRVPSPIKSIPRTSSEDYSRRLKDSYEKQLAVVKASEKLLKEHDGRKSILSKHILALKKNLQEVGKCIEEIEMQEYGVTDKVSKNKFHFQCHVSDKRKQDAGNVEGTNDNIIEAMNESITTFYEFFKHHSQELPKPKHKSYVQPTEIEIPPKEMRNIHIKRQEKIQRTEDDDRSAGPRNKVSSENAMIKLADNMRKSKELIDDTLAEKDKIIHLERKYVQKVETLYKDQQKLLQNICQALSGSSIASSEEDGPDNGSNYNQPIDPTLEPDEFKFEGYETINRVKFKLNSMPDIEHFLRNQSMSEKLAKANFELEKIKKEMQLMKMQGIEETKQNQDILSDDRNMQHAQEMVQERTNIPMNASTDSNLRKLIGTINHKYSILRGKGCEGNTYETTLTQKIKNFPVTSEGEKPEFNGFSHTESLAAFSNARNALKKLEEEVKKMLPIAPRISRQPGIEPDTPIVVSHHEENISANILRVSQNRNTGTQTPETSSTDSLNAQEASHINRVNIQGSTINGSNAQQSRHINDVDIRQNGANSQQTRHINGVNAQQNTTNGANAQTNRHLSEVNALQNEDNAQQTEHIDEVNIQQNGANVQQTRLINGVNTQQNATNEANTQRTRHLSEANALHNGANVQQTRHINGVNIRQNATNGADIQRTRRINEANALHNGDNVQQTRHINGVNIRQNATNGADIRRTRRINEANALHGGANVQQTRHINGVNIRHDATSGADILRTRGINEARLSDKKLQKQKKNVGSLRTKIPTATGTVPKHHLTFDEVLKLTNKGSSGFDVSGIDTFASTPPLGNQNALAGMNVNRQQRPSSIREDVAETIPKTRDQHTLADMNIMRQSRRSSVREDVPETTPETRDHYALVDMNAMGQQRQNYLSEDVPETNPETRDQYALEDMNAMRQHRRSSLREDVPETTPETRDHYTLADMNAMRQQRQSSLSEDVPETNPETRDQYALADMNVTGQQRRNSSTEDVPETIPETRDHYTLADMNAMRQRRHTLEEMNAMRQYRRSSLREDVAETIPKTRDHYTLADMNAVRPRRHTLADRNVMRQRGRSSVRDDAEAILARVQDRLRTSMASPSNFQDILESTRISPRDSISERESRESFNRARMLSEANGYLANSNRTGFQDDLQDQRGNINLQELEEGAVNNLPKYELEQDNQDEIEEGSISNLSNYVLDEDSQDEIEEGSISDLSNYVLDQGNQAELEERAINNSPNYELEQDNRDAIEERNQDEIRNLPNYNFVQCEAGPANLSEHSQEWYALDPNAVSTLDNREAGPDNSSEDSQEWYGLDDIDREHENNQRELPVYGSMDVDANGRHRANNESSERWYRLDVGGSPVGEMNEEGNTSCSANLQYKHPKMSFESQAMRPPKRSREESHANKQKQGFNGNHFKLTFNRKLSADGRAKNTLNGTEYETMAKLPYPERWKYTRNMLLMNPEQSKRPQICNFRERSPKLRAGTLSDLRTENFRTQSELPADNDKFSNRRRTFDSIGSAKQRKKISKLYEEIMSQ